MIIPGIDLWSQRADIAAVATAVHKTMATHVADWTATAWTGKSGEELQARKNP